MDVSFHLDLMEIPWQVLAGAGGSLYTAMAVLVTRFLGRRYLAFTNHTRSDQEITTSLMFLLWPIALAGWTIYRFVAAFGSGLGNFTYWLASGKK